MPPSALAAMYNPMTRARTWPGSSSPRWAMAAAGTPAIQAPSSARASTSSEKSGAQAEARAQRAAPSRPKRISRSRPQRSATRLNGISNSAIVPVPAVTLRLTVPAEIPKASLSCGSSGCVP